MENLYKEKGMIKKIMTAACLLGAFNANGLIISLAPGTQTGVGGADLLRSFGSNQYQMLLTAAQIGLRSDDNIDALHFGSRGSIGSWFSVDAASTGLASTEVRGQSDLNEQSGDVFASPPIGSSPHSLVADEGVFGLDSSDNIDAMYWNDFSVSDSFVFSLAQGSPTLGLNGWSGADILRSNNGVVDIFLEAGIGLLSGLQALDDIDALDGDDLTFSYSLAPGSPSLGSNSAADIFDHTGLITAAATIGLNQNDNIDALASTFDCSIDILDDCIPVPAPASIFIFLLGLTGLVVSRKT
jgi:hypothetical protein